MDQNWIRILVILVFYQKITSGAGENKIVKDGQAVEIKCKPSELGTMIIWFRVLDNSGMEFIASFSNNGIPKTPLSSYNSTFSDSRITQGILTLLSFKKASDSGVYTCASLVGGRELKFGAITRLVAEKTVTVQLNTPTPTKQNLCTTAQKCTCDTVNKIGKTWLNENKFGVEYGSPMYCNPIILGPLVGGCGLLLLLLIITTLYCNKIRTRRCPHHYKRKPRTTPGGKQMQTQTSRHV